MFLFVLSWFVVFNCKCLEILLYFGMISCIFFLWLNGKVFIMIGFGFLVCFVLFNVVCISFGKFLILWCFIVVNFFFVNIVWVGEVKKNEDLVL